MAEPVIRALSANEIETLGSLAHEIWHAHYPSIISREQIDFMLAQRYSPAAIRANMRNQYWDAAWQDGRMAGFAHSFADDVESAWKLDKLYVHPEYQRQGIGQTLLDKTKQHAMRAGARRLILCVNKHNAIALAAYAKYGFSVYGEHVLGVGKGFVMDDYLLELKLCS
jgi:ribosomal protein S18 acetylase RimI-like enzyme